MNNIDLMNYWTESSDEDYDTMLYMKKGKRNTWCLFLGHLLIEKLLKGLYAKNNPENPVAPKIHNLILLSKNANLDVPNGIREKIQIINTFNISARCDDFKKSFAEKCTDEYTDIQVKNVEEVFMNKEKGITLLALIVTIIILLILARSYCCYIDR